MDQRPKPAHNFRTHLRPDSVATAVALTRAVKSEWQAVLQAAADDGRSVQSLTGPPTYHPSGLLQPAAISPTAYIPYIRYILQLPAGYQPDPMHNYKPALMHNYRPEPLLLPADFFFPLFPWSSSGDCDLRLSATGGDLLGCGSG